MLTLSETVRFLVIAWGTHDAGIIGVLGWVAGMAYGKVRGKGRYEAAPEAAPNCALWALISQPAEANDSLSLTTIDLFQHLRIRGSHLWLKAGR